MRTIIYVTFLTILLIACSKTKEWKIYKYEDFNFAVSLPYEPEVTVKELQGSDYNLIVSKSPDRELEFTSYSIFYFDSKNSFNSHDSSSVTQYFAEIEEQQENLNSVKIISKKEFGRFQYPAREYVTESADGYQTHVSIFILVNDKSYQLDLLYPTAKKDNPEHIKFIDSFKLGTK